MKISIRDAIDFGDWISCMFDDSPSPSPNEVKIRINTFSKADLSLLDEPERLDSIELSYNIWLLNFSVINLSRQPLDNRALSKHIVLMDTDDYEFRAVDDDYFTFLSEFSVKHGMRNFYLRDIPPKIKKSGALAFELPEDFDAMHIAISDGKII